MQLSFQLESNQGSRPLPCTLHTLVIAGWAGRDPAAIEHHIEELAALGVARPSDVPLFYRVADQQITQAEQVQVCGPHTSGEVEALVLATGGRLYVGIASDHTDRQLEAHSVALSKQVCAKPVGHQLWAFEDVEPHWDQLVLRSWIVENDTEVLYQSGPLASLRTPRDLIARFLASTGRAAFDNGCAMTCGTVAALGGVRPSTTFIMELHDPVLGRSLRHRYSLDILPEVA